MNISLTSTNKGKHKLFIDGYSYNVNRKTESTYNWECSKRKSHHCKGRVVTQLLEGNHTIWKPPSLHSHEPSAYEKDVCEANTAVKCRAKESELPPSLIIRESIMETLSTSRVYLPNKQAQNKKIHRVRSSNIKEPDDLNNINIPENLRYLEGELFVLCEAEFEEDKIIILGTSSSLKLLSQATCWIMDGTFDVVPSIMRQLFSIHGNIEGEIVPLVFCLMSKKSVKAYDQLFFNLRKLGLELNINLNPKKIISDFEKAIFSSAKAFFPQTAFSGCLFHFGQIIWRKLQKERLAKKYGNSESFAIQIRMLKSLAFVPPKDVYSYYTILHKALDDDDARKISTWFKQNYICESSKSKRGSQYKPEFWSVVDYGNGSECFPRTQNCVEAWHRRLKVVVGKRHAGLYKIIQDLSKELILAKTRIEKVISGEKLPKNKKRIQRNNQIKRVIKKRNSLGKLEYLKRIAHSVMLN